jgi:hypothetical protein
MSLKRTAFTTEHRVIAAAHTPLSVMAAVAVGGVAAGMPLTDILLCGLVAGAGVALFCAAVAWLFDAPMGPGLSGLWDDSGRLAPLRVRRPRQPGPPAPAHRAIRSSSTAISRTSE